MNKKISNTAAYIAIKFYGLTLNNKLGNHFPDFVKDFYGDIIRFLPKSLSWYYQALSRRGWRKFFIFTEELLLPGDLMHIISRKFYIHQLAEKATHDGFEQIVILGAGFDHLGAYFSQKKISVFEIDTPFMMEKKQQFLEDSKYSNEHLHCRCVNVNKTAVTEYLKNHSQFHPAKKTLFIAEGFFDYLTLETTQDLLQEMASLCPDHKLITTFFSLDELNFFHRFSFTSGVALVGEAIKLPLNRKGFLDMLESHNYSVEQSIRYDEMRRNLIQPSHINLPVLKGFYVFEAKFTKPRSTKKTR